MSLTSKFDRLQKGNTGNENDASQTDDRKEADRYATAGHVRNLCFIQPNGEQLFLNYAYLISGAFSPENNIITLSYTTHIITIKGHHLDVLFDSLMAQIPKQIVCVDKRYEAAIDETETVVTEIVIKVED